MQSIERLKLGINGWLVHHELNGDTSFFTPKEWRARGEEYCTESKLILVFEGGLFSLLNGYSGNVELYDEFDRFVRGFGYYYEMGNAWNMGFYPLEDEPTATEDRRYAEKLRDPRWIEKRNHIRRRASNACEECGKAGYVEIHHCCYVRGWQPWEYPDYLLKCVCRSCHEQRAVIEMRMTGLLSSLTMEQMEILRDSLANHAFYWYEKDAVLDFIAHIQGSEEKMDEAYLKLRRARRADV
jgi:hypothetical protein